VLELVRLTKRFGSTVALDELSFEVRPGEVLGFLGPNGSGKTTAMRAIFGLVRLDGGEVRWQGKPVGEADRRRFGYMPEERGLYPSMRALDHLVYLAQLHGISAPEARRRSSAWLERLEVSDPRARIEALSLGNRQRVQLAAAIVHEPDLLVLDEPFSGLDPPGVDAMSGVLRALAGLGRAILFSSHQLDVVEGVCDRVAIVRSGRIVLDGAVETLAEAGRPMLEVEVEGVEATWARSLFPWADVAEVAGPRVVLALGPDAPPDASDQVLDLARRQGSVRHFAFRRRRLAEIFREALEVDASAAPEEATAPEDHLAGLAGEAR